MRSFDNCSHKGGLKQAGVKLRKFFAARNTEPTGPDNSSLLKVLALILTGDILR